MDAFLVMLRPLWHAVEIAQCRVSAPARSLMMRASIVRRSVIAPLVLCRETPRQFDLASPILPASPTLDESGREFLAASQVTLAEIPTAIVIAGLLDLTVEPLAGPGFRISCRRAPFGTRHVRLGTLLAPACALIVSGGMPGPGRDIDRWRDFERMEV